MEDYSSRIQRSIPNENFNQTQIKKNVSLMNINQPVNLNQTTSMHEPTPLNRPFNPNCFINSELSKNTLYSSIHAKGGGLIDSVSHRKASASG